MIGIWLGECGVWSWRSLRLGISLVSDLSLRIFMVLLWSLVVISMVFVLFRISLRWLIVMIRIRFFMRLSLMLLCWWRICLVIMLFKSFLSMGIKFRNKCLLWLWRVRLLNFWCRCMFVELFRRWVFLFFCFVFMCWLVIGFFVCVCWVIGWVG